MNAAMSDALLDIGSGCSLYAFASANPKFPPTWVGPGHSCALLPGLVLFVRSPNGFFFLEELTDLICMATYHIHSYLTGSSKSFCYNLFANNARLCLVKMAPKQTH